MCWNWSRHLDYLEPNGSTTHDYRHARTLVAEMMVVPRRRISMLSSLVLERGSQAGSTSGRDSIPILGLGRVNSIWEGRTRMLIWPFSSRRDQTWWRACHSTCSRKMALIRVSARWLCRSAWIISWKHIKLCLRKELQKHHNPLLCWMYVNLEYIFPLFSPLARIPTAMRHIWLTKL